MAGRGHGEGRIYITMPPDRVLPPLVASENWEGVDKAGKLGSGADCSGFEALGLWGGCLARQPCVSRSGRLDTTRIRVKGSTTLACV